MKLLLPFLFSTLVCSQNISEKLVKRLKDKKEITYEDLAHENPGCFENSACTEEMGLLTAKLVKILKKRNNIKSLRSFFNKHGLPLNHFTRTTDEKSIFFSSRCRQHNPKEGEKTFEAFRYMKKIEFTQNQIFEKAQILNSEQRYYIPLRDTPYYIKNDKLIILKEIEDFSFYLAISQLGNITPIQPRKSELETAFKHTENVRECPEDKDLNNYFLGSYCRKIYNFDTKKVDIIRIDWACP